MWRWLHCRWSNNFLITWNIRSQNCQLLCCSAAFWNPWISSISLFTMKKWLCTIPIEVDIFHIFMSRKTKNSNYSANFTWKFHDVTLLCREADWKGNLLKKMSIFSNGNIKCHHVPYIIVESLWIFYFVCYS